MENVVRKLVQIDDCVEVINEYLCILEPTEVAGECNWVNSLNHSSECRAHLIEELQLELCEEHLGASIQHADVAHAD